MQQPPRLGLHGCGLGVGRSGAGRARTAPRRARRGAARPRRRRRLSSSSTPAIRSAERAASDSARWASRAQRSRAWSCSARASAIRRARARKGVRYGTSSSGRSCAGAGRDQRLGGDPDHLGAEAEGGHPDRDESAHVVVVRARGAASAANWVPVVSSRLSTSRKGVGSARSELCAQPTSASSRPASSRRPSCRSASRVARRVVTLGSLAAPIVPNWHAGRPIWQCLAGIPSA